MIVPNFRRPALLRRCLTSVCAAVDGAMCGVEVIVVDDGSGDDSCAVVRDEFPLAKLVASTENRGYPAAINAGIASCRGDWVLTLNNDTEVDAGVFDALLAVAQADPGVGIVGAQQRFASHPGVISSAGMSIDRRGHAVDRLLGRPATESEAQPVEVFGACGAAALYRRSLLDALGGFDEAFAFGLEDADLAWRARMRGWRCLYAPGAIVYHDLGGTVPHGSSIRLFQAGRNRVLLLAKNLDRRQLWRYAPQIIAFDVAYVTYAGARFKTLAPLQGRLAGIRLWRGARAAGEEARTPIHLDPPEPVRNALARRRAWRYAQSQPADDHVDPSWWGEPTPPAGSARPRPRTPPEMSGRTGSMPGSQEAAYELAVSSAWRDADLKALVERAFLHEDVEEALTCFRASEDYARVRRLLRELGIGPGARVLDLGGGRGLLAAALAEDGFDSTLCEPNRSSVCGTEAAARLRSLRGDSFAIAALPVDRLAGPQFDAVICRAVLHHVDGLPDLLRAVLGVLVPGGVLIASDEPTVRRAADAHRARSLHPFVRFGVQEDAHPRSRYRSALAEAGFQGVRDRFPVSLGDYRSTIHPRAPAPIVVAGYARIRARAVLRPVPGQVRSFTGRAPASGLARPSRRRRLRLGLPQPWSLLLASVATATVLARSADARRSLREEGLIEAAVERGRGPAVGELDTTERVVEVPWVFARLASAPGRVLDVGSANAPLVHHRLLRRLPAVSIDAVDLLPVPLDRVRAHLADARALPFAAATFDSVVCISTLEHVGLDNERYTRRPADARAGGDLAALRELRRVLAPAGRILVTVPGGQDDDHGWFRQYAPESFGALVAAAGLTLATLDCFVHEPGRGWRPADAAEVPVRRYGDGAPAAAAVLCAELRCPAAVGHGPSRADVGPTMRPWPLDP